MDRVSDESEYHVRWHVGKDCRERVERVFGAVRARARFRYCASQALTKGRGNVELVHRGVVIACCVVRAADAWRAERLAKLAAKREDTGPAGALECSSRPDDRGGH